MAKKNKNSSDENKGKNSDKKEGKRKNKARAPWKDRQMDRLSRAIKAVERIDRVISAAKPPGVNAAAVSSAFGAIGMAALEISKLADDWKPARGSNPGTGKKVGIGSVIKVRDDLKDDDLKVYKYMPQALFAKATVKYDDGRNWLVECADGVNRLLRKKHTTLV